jgi:peptidoglycan hydrolase CwlO-like protein
MRAIKVLMPLIAVIAVAALAGAAVAITKKPTSYTPQIRELQTEFASANSEIDSLKADSPAGKVVALQSRVDSLNNTIASFKICIPELEQQLNGESINTDSTSGYLTDAYINNPTIISANCTKLLNG